jgi:hypothetical protein
MPRVAKSYNYEKTLVEDICSYLETGESPWGEVHLSREFDYKNGRIDIIAVDMAKDLFAFEVKLTNWRKALSQAYRNTTFTTESYVVLPFEVAESVQKYFYEFERRAVGLCAANSDHLQVLIPANRRNNPIQEWLKEDAINSTGA